MSKILFGHFGQNSVISNCLSVVAVETVEPPVKRIMPQVLLTKELVMISRRGFGVFSLPELVGSVG